MTDLHYLVFSALLAWVMLVTASLIRSGGITPRGILIAFGNRDDVAPPSALSGRADRAAVNMLENLVLFTALLFAARASDSSATSLASAAALFFWARLAYFPVYLAGIKFLRTALWTVSLVALGQLALAAL